MLGPEEMGQRDENKKQYSQAIHRAVPRIDVNTILEDRGSKYGDFEGHAQITQDLKDVMWACKKWKYLSPAQKEALEMCMHKIGRILNGDPFYKDSWVDLAGYPTLVANMLKD